MPIETVQSEVPSGDQIGTEWHPWSADAVAKARAKGRPVMVDFTANWCINCKLFSDPALESDVVLNKLKEINGIRLKADFTRKDPVIAAELRRFERAGVPLVLVYPKDATQPPQLLPTVLTPTIVLEALESAAK